MPFDGIGFAFDERVSKMNQVIQLLATPDKWCKGTLKTYDGHRCIRGAMMDVADAHCLAPIILRAIREVTEKHYFSIETFNDHPYTDHAQVLRVLSRAFDDLIRAQIGVRCSHGAGETPSGGLSRKQSGRPSDPLTARIL
jgi:hypothetical protein